MTGARISYIFDDKPFQASLQRLGGVLSPGVLGAIGTALVTTTERRFDTGTEPFGARWAKLLPAYAAIKRGTNILVASGNLRKSITYRVSGSSVSVGSGFVYAAVHQFGATITPKRAPFLSFRLGVTGPRGGLRRAFVHVKAVHIPARPYLGFGPADQRAVMEVLDVFVGRSLH